MGKGYKGDEVKLMDIKQLSLVELFKAQIEINKEIMSRFEFWVIIAALIIFVITVYVMRRG